MSNEILEYRRRSPLWIDVTLLVWALAGLLGEIVVILLGHFCWQPFPCQMWHALPMFGLPITSATLGACFVVKYRMPRQRWAIWLGVRTVGVALLWLLYWAPLFMLDVLGSDLRFLL